ncbi:MAG: penicillin-binding protein 2 [Candidatus Marinimicrobia bacterium]|nr:penicillin-binding protein 2 [Candidatus Neomarinimicrobiota bacterium]
MLHKDRKLIIFLAGIFLIIFFRFYFLQIQQQQEYEKKAGGNSIRNIILNAPRGIIFDRNHNPIVDNRQIYDLSLIPFDVTEHFNYTLFEKVTGLEVNKIAESVKKKKNSFYRFRPFTVKRHIDFEKRSQLEENKLDLPGMIFSEFPARTYPDSAKLTHVLGYLRVVTEESAINPPVDLKYKLGDVFGFSGIEKMYESSLRGKDGTEYRLVDIYGIDHGVLAENPGTLPVPGEHLILSIDAKMQALVEKLFLDKKGAVVALAPATGEVLAIHSAPDYNLDSFAGPVPIELWEGWNSDPDKPLLNRVVQGLYPPGSTMKLAAAALAVEKKKVSTDWKVHCSGVYGFGDRNFHCWNTAGHGEVDLNLAIQQSCNVYFYHLMQKLSFEEWRDMVEQFHFGEKTGIDILGEKKGNVPNKDYMNSRYGRYGWAAGNLLTFIIGQGDVLVTPLQVAQFMSLIATDGNTYQPHLVKNQDTPAVQVHLQQNTWEFIQKATWNVVNHKEGTGKQAAVKGGGVHGKTGTAQNPHGDDHSWFAGFMNVKDKPIISLAVIVEHGGKGSVEAASISRKIFQYAEQNSPFK